MQVKTHLLFWFIVSAILTMFFSANFNSYTYAIYFTTLLLPVIVATSYFFNYYLVPEYLFTNRYGKFTLYLIYTIIVSLYLELVVIFLAFIYLANYNIVDMHPLVRNVWILTLTLYAIVFIQGFILLVRKYQNTKITISELEEEKQKSSVGILSVKSDRQNKRINFEDILYIESLADYVKIHIRNQPPIVTKQKISKIQIELTNVFLRIHRSFIINTNHLTSYGSDHVMIDQQKLPVSRTYKVSVKAFFE
jgi:two-component system response regulator LytT